MRLLVILFWMLVLPCVHAAEAETVRVGFYEVPHFQEYVPDRGVFRGYSAEYLEAVAAYAGWQLEFVPIGLQEGIEQVAEGKLDLMAHVPLSEQQAASLEVWENPYESSPVFLLVSDRRADIAYGEHGAMNTLTVGLVRDEQTINALFSKFCRDKGCTPGITYFETYEEVQAALQGGAIDAFLSCRFTAGHFRVVDEFGTVFMRYATTKGNSALAAEAARATEALHRNAPDLVHELYVKYFRDENRGDLVLSSDEHAFIREHPVINVSYNANWQPLAYRDGDGGFAGAVRDVYDEITKFTGLRFRFVPSDSLVGAFSHFVSGETQLMADLPYDYIWGAKKKAMLTVPFMRVIAVAAYRNGGARNGVVAMPEGYYQIFRSRDMLGENYVFRTFRTMDECVRAVLDGEAEWVFLNTYQLEYYRARAAYRELSFKILPNMDYMLAVGVSRNADPRLFSIMNKAIQSIGTPRLDEILRNAAMNAQSRSLIDAVYANTAVAAAVFGLLGMLVTVVVGGQMYVRRMRDKNRQIAEATRAKERFFANISHDMRSPLNGIIGYTELGLGAATLEDAIGYFRDVRISGQFLLQLVNDTLDLSKLENQKMDLHPRPMLNSELVASVQAIIAPLAAEKRISFHVVREPACEGRVSADPMRIQQIFINLLNNAVKFTPEGGAVTLACAEREKGDEVDYRVRVTDTGIGISPDFIPRLFDAYSQEVRDVASPQSGGTGLGLYIVRMLVDLLHGTIDVASVPDEGTTFTVSFTLPRAAEPHPGGSSATERAGTASCAGKQILLCEDHPINAALVRTMLNDWGMQVTWTKNGREALDAFIASEPGTFDLLLMDRRMPVLDGVEAVKALRELPRRDAGTVPVIAMTGDADPEDLQECLDAGMDATLVKPFDRQTLFETMQPFLCPDGRSGD